MKLIKYQGEYWTTKALKAHLIKPIKGKITKKIKPN